VWAVVLIVALALRAFQACPDLSTDTDSVAFLDGLDGVSNSDGLSDDFVADTNG
jgi:hypothetical protein